MVDGVKAPRDDVQAVIRQMQAMPHFGAGHHELSDRMSDTQNRKMRFSGVRQVLTAE